MAETVSFNLRLDKDIKRQAEQLFAELGMNMTTGINVFLRQAIREHSIPFKITTETEFDVYDVWKGDSIKYPSYDEYIADSLRKTERLVAEGKMKYYTEDEVKDMLEAKMNEKV